MKILIAPWGNPKKWGRAIYVFKRGGGDEVKVESNTSLVALQEALRPDKTLILGLETLAERGNNYDEVVNEAKRVLEESAESFGVEQYDVLVLPGRGAFVNAVFDGDVLDYYFYLVEELSEVLVECFEDLKEVHLDLSHGINYVPVLTYTALREILGVVNAFSRVRMVIYNSDPYVEKASRELTVNVVEDTVPPPQPCNEGVVRSNRVVEPRISISSKERRRLYMEKLSELKGIIYSEVSAFVGAVYNGFPLAVFRFYPDLYLLKSAVDTAVKVYREYVSVESRRDRLKVIKRLRFTRDFKVYALAWMTAELLKKKGLVCCRRHEVELEELKKLGKGLFEYDERLKERIYRDLHELEEKASGKLGNKWKAYSEMLGEPLKDRPDRRNFIAHSGFEKNVTELKAEDGKVYVRYREELEGDVVKCCKRGLR